MDVLCPASTEPLGHHFFTPNSTPLSNRIGVVMILLSQHTSAQGSRLVTIALGPERLGGKDSIK